MSRDFDCIKDLKKDLNVWKIPFRVLDSWIVTASNGNRHMELIIGDTKVREVIFDLVTWCLCNGSSVICSFSSSTMYFVFSVWWIVAVLFDVIYMRLCDSCVSNFTGVFFFFCLSCDIMWLEPFKLKLNLPIQIKQAHSGLACRHLILQIFVVLKAIQCIWYWTSKIWPWSSSWWFRACFFCFFYFEKRKLFFSL